jgi:hypothetical protein
MPATPFRQCRYSVFLSYSRDDDHPWQDWISTFHQELRTGLRARMLGTPLPELFFDVDNGPLNGPLGARLCKAIGESFSMLIFVHDNYVASQWCLQELAYFRQCFGDEGFRERLYIVAMSQPAIERLMQRPEWRELLPWQDQLWLPYYDEENPEFPLPMFVDDTRRRVLSNAFFSRYVKLREQLARSMREAWDNEREAAPYPGAAPPAAAAAPAVPAVQAADAGDPHWVRVYVESNVEQQRFWDSLGQQVVFAWDQVVALEKPEPPLRLRPTGLPMTDILSRPRLDDADGVVLVWGWRTPDSLASQIAQVEPKLSGPHFAPGLIAYLMERPDDQPASDSINNWPVVRFATRSDGSVVVLADDQPRLARFLRGALEHKRRAAAAAPSQAAGVCTAPSAAATLLMAAR